MKKVLNASRRDDVRQWAEAALNRSNLTADVLPYLTAVFEDDFPFQPFSAEAQPFQIGRKGWRLSARRQLEEMVLQDPRNPSQYRSRWLACAGEATSPTRYYEVFTHEWRDDAMQRLREQVSSSMPFGFAADLKRATELFAAILTYGPLSTMSQVPSQDLRDLASVIQRLDAGKEAYHPEPVHPSDGAKDAWRRFLTLRLAEQGWSADEVTIEALHALGWRATVPVAQFLLDASRSAGGHGVCLGPHIPFCLKMACRREGDWKVLGAEKYQVFVVGTNIETRQLTVRPLVCRDYPGLVRAGEWPKSMANARVPREMNLRLYIDDNIAPLWVRAWEHGAIDGSVTMDIAIVDLPGGNFGFALPGDSPLCTRPRNQMFNVTGDVSNMLYFELNISTEAQLLLTGEHPGWQRVRDLTIFDHIPALGMHFLKGGTVAAMRISRATPPSSRCGALSVAAWSSMMAMSMARTPMWRSSSSSLR